MIKRAFLLLYVLMLCAGLRAQNEQAIDSLKRALAKTAPDTNRVNILNSLSWETRFTDESLRYCEEARSLSEKLKFGKGYANALSNTGNTYFNLSNPSESLKWHEAALREWQKLGDKKGIARAYSNIGLAYIGLDNYPESLKYQLLSLKIREDIRDKEGLSASYFNTAAVYFQLQRFDEALEISKKGMELDRERGDMAGVAGWHSNIGSINRHMQEYDESLKHHKEAVRIREELGEIYDLSGSYMNIANTYEDLGDMGQALEYHKKALSLAEKLRNQEHIIGSRINIGRVYSMQGDHINALAFLHSGLDSARVYNMRDYMVIVYTDLAEAYARKKDFASAYAYQVLHAQLKDSLLNETNSQQVAEMQTLYETEKKQKENEILKQKNQIQQLESEQKDEELEKQSIVLYSVTGGLLLMILLAFFVYRGYKEKKEANIVISMQKMEVERQKELVEEKNKDITDSINYAKKIQRALLPSDKMLQRLLPEHFVLHLPKDIVSGDFYWAVSPSPGTVIVAVADCTGHGVPGAFMSMIGISLLNEIVIEKKITRPDLVLNHLREGVIKALSGEDGEAGRDGMDIVLCRYDMERRVLDFAAANNPLWVIGENGLAEFKGDKFPVGPHAGEIKPFTLREIPLERDMVIYAFSDGYADQFGGPHGKKFKYKQLQELLVSIKDKPVEEQRSILLRSFESWKKGLGQVDDVLVTGIRV